MSTTFSVPPPLSLTGRIRSARPAHESISWPRATVSWHLMRRWAQRRAQRKALAYLIAEAHLLADIGLSREQASREVRKPFWRR